MFRGFRSSLAEHITDVAVVTAYIEHPLGRTSLVPQRDLVQKEPQALKKRITGTLVVESAFEPRPGTGSR
jgi:hypothetical protein